MSVIGKKMNYEIMEENVSEHEKDDNGMITIGEALVNRGIEYGIKALILDNCERGESEDLIIKNLQKRFHLSEEEAKKYVERF